MSKTIRITAADMATAKAAVKYNVSDEVAARAVALATARKDAERAAKLARMVDVPADMTDAIASLVIEMKTFANVKSAFQCEAPIALQLLSATREYKKTGAMRLYPETIETIRPIIA